AISEAYRNILPSGTFPVSILFIAIPYQDVDVNVHPAKTEVRFRHQSFVHDAIRDSIVEALTEDKTIVPIEAAGGLDNPFAPPELQPRMPDSWASEDPVARAPYSLNTVPQTVSGYEVPLGLNFNPGSQTPAAYPEFDRVKHQVRPLGQIRDSFIVATDLTGL